MPRLSDAQGHEALINTDGSLKTQVVGSLPNVAALTNNVKGGVFLSDYAQNAQASILNGPSDGIGEAYGFLNTYATERVFNEITWDRKRGNTQGIALASAAQTASLNSADITIYNGAKLAVYLDVTAASGTSPTLDVTVKAKDPASGKYFLLGTFTQKTGVTSDVLFIGNGAGSTFATRTIRVEAVIGGTTPSFTFSVGYSATVS